MRAHLLGGVPKAEVEAIREAERKPTEPGSRAFGLTEGESRRNDDDETPLEEREKAVLQRYGLLRR